MQYDVILFFVSESRNIAPRLRVDKRLWSCTENAFVEDLFLNYGIKHILLLLNFSIRLHRRIRGRRRSPIRQDCCILKRTNQQMRRHLSTFRCCPSGLRELAVLSSPIASIRVRVTDISNLLNKNLIHLFVASYKADVSNRLSKVQFRISINEGLIPRIMHLLFISAVGCFARGLKQTLWCPFEVFIFKTDKVTRVDIHWSKYSTLY